MVDGISTLLLSLEMDGVLLWLTSRLLGLRTRHFRLLTGALIGILPTLWVLLRQNLYALPWGIVAIWPIVMLSVALAPLPRRLWLASYAILLGGTVVAAGLALAMLTWADRVAPNLPSWPWMFLLLPGIVTGLTIWGPKWGRRHANAVGTLGDVRLLLDGKAMVVRALWDSGNQLQDPVLRRPVIVIETKVAIEWLPVEVLHWVVEVTQGHLATPPAAWQGKLGIISFHSLGGNGRLPVLAIDYAEGLKDGVAYRLMPVVAGFSAAPVAQDHSYQALCNPSCIAPLRGNSGREGVGA